jgi:hypothetical protein
MWLAVMGGGAAGAQSAEVAGKNLTTIFSYTNFSDVTGLTFNGSAVQSEDRLLVSAAQTYDIGAVFYSNQVNVGEGFSTAFTLRIAPYASAGTAK